MPSLQKLTLITLLTTLALSTTTTTSAQPVRRSGHGHSHGLKKRHCARPSKTSSVTMPLATATGIETAQEGDGDGMMTIVPVGMGTATSVGVEDPSSTASREGSVSAGASVIGNQLIQTGVGASTSRKHRTRTRTRSTTPTPTPIITTSSSSSFSAPDPTDLETFPTPITPDQPTSTSASTSTSHASATPTSTSTSKSIVSSSSSSLPSSAPPVTSTTKPSSAAPTTTTGLKTRAGLAVDGNSGSNWESWEGGKVDWLYNWGSTKPAGLPSSIEYVPMLWGTDTSSFTRNQPSFPTWGVNSLLSFNEPDMGTDVGGSSITPVEAAKIHKQIFTKDVNEEYRIGGPAVARGGKGWLKEWETACAGECLYDFLPIHFYGKDASQFAPYLQEMLAVSNKPLWITEVACIEFSGTTYFCNEHENEAFMKQIVEDMNDPVNRVERYSWFGAFVDTASGGKAFGIMNTDGSPNALGEVYLA